MVELLGATFKLRLAPDSAPSTRHAGARVDCDFALRMNTPTGLEEWDFGFGHWDMDISGLRDGVAPERFFRPMMQSLFDDLLSDMAECGWSPDKSFDQIPVAVEIPDEVWRVARRPPRS